MARKSRKHHVALNVLNDRNEKTFYSAAGYVRLSGDDKNKGGDSIKTQQSIIESFITDKHDIHLSNFYVDNNATGTNFERSGFQIMLDDIERGKINCVICKDFSRFGRNAIETGYFIERVFPLRHIRFISISDGFDSGDHEGGTGGVDVALKFLIHEFYSRDISRKVKSSIYERMRRGEYVTGVFGYRKDVNGNLSIDSDTAKTVRRIFVLALDHKSPLEIGRCLYKEKRPTPSAYMKQKDRAEGDKIFDCVWSKSSIETILSDEQYIGTYVAGKTKRQLFGNCKQTRIDKSEWIRIPNHHPAIIEKAVFDAVQEFRHANGRALQKYMAETSERCADRQNSPLKGKVICGFCGRIMTLSNTKNTAFHCQFSRPASDMPCHDLRILDRDLQNMLLSYIRKQYAYWSNIEDGLMPSQAFNYEREINDYNAEKRTLYEKLVRGEIEKNAFKSAKDEYNDAIGRLSRDYGASKAKMAQQSAAEASCAELHRLMEIAICENVLMKELVELIVDKVLVYPDGRVEIDRKALFSGQ